ncbi:formate hydrogenlyase maturation HycH family protein [Escherichia coli]
MSEKVVFSQLSRKFIDENDATPAEAQQVVYYSLAIGHHLGVIDCLEAALTCPWDEYLAWIATLEAGSEARRKMEGVPKYGEIVIDINHVPMLANAFDKARAAKPAAKWKVCRNMVRSSSTLTMCRCWPMHSIKPGQRKLRSSRNGVQCC